MIRIQRYCLFLLCTLVSFSISAQRLSKTERKIVAKAKAYDQESIAFLEKVVNLNSGTMNLE